ncbi:IS5 family transposase [Microbulbifer rhizosphaerae]|uniref:IS5 family transposase n=1 Tax=Microbulbifer rhizosphaerae TaxID=1562603 RepID=A0A7W4ZAU9_9GAMM|nr:IS5 family transposase [Microbulbifer rhizosphaerae]
MDNAYWYRCILGLIYSVDITAANANDITGTERVLYGGESRVWGDTGYTGVENREEL